MYAKVFSQIYDGTLCTKGPWEALVTFQQMLVLADQDGVVDMTAAAISRRTTIPLEIISKGIEVLLQEDAESRTPIENGRRLLPLAEGRNWGWLIVNYKHYRALKREEDRRDYHREYWHKRKKNKEDSTATQQAQPSQPIAEAHAEANTEAVVSVAKATAGAAAKMTDPGEIIFGYGLSMLTNAGTTEKQARSFLGGLRKAHGDEALIDKLRECARSKPLQPLEWLAAALPPPPSGRAAAPNKQEALEQRNRNIAQAWAAKGSTDASV